MGEQRLLHLPLLLQSLQVLKKHRLTSRPVVRGSLHRAGISKRKWSGKGTVLISLIQLSDLLVVVLVIFCKSVITMGYAASNGLLLSCHLALCCYLGQLYVF